MSHENDSAEDKNVPLQDVVLSNSWALQAILNYLEEMQPGARDRIWQHYLNLKNQVESQQDNDDDTDRPVDDHHSN